MQDERAQIYKQQCNLSHKHDPEITNYSHHNDCFAQQCPHEILVLLFAAATSQNQTTGHSTGTEENIGRYCEHKFLSSHQ